MALRHHHGSIRPITPAITILLALAIIVLLLLSSSATATSTTTGHPITTTKTITHLHTSTNHPKIDMSEDDDQDSGDFFAFIILCALFGLFFLSMLGISFRQCCCPPAASAGTDNQPTLTIYGIAGPKQVEFAPEIGSNAQDITMDIDEGQAIQKLGNPPTYYTSQVVRIDSEISVINNKGKRTTEKSKLI